MMKIGIDLDNTIINYQPAFLAGAIKRGLVDRSFDGSKTQLRDSLIAAGNEKGWQALQGYVYGQGIGEADLYPGVIEFLEKRQMNQDELYIVSHKTVYGHYDESKTELREAAIRFLEDHGVLNFIPREKIFFRSTRAEKLNVITELKVDYFIDDLPEVLQDPAFPQHSKRVHFVPHSKKVYSLHGVHTCKSWEEIALEVVA